MKMKVYQISMALWHDLRIVLAGRAFFRREGDKFLTKTTQDLTKYEIK